MRYLAAVLVAWCCLTSSANSQTLFDSGKPGMLHREKLGGGYYCEQQELPPEFCTQYGAIGLIFDRPSTVTGVEAYLTSVSKGITYNLVEGIVDIALYDENWTELNRTHFYMRPQEIGWRGVRGIDWQVTSGTYWFSFEVPRNSKFTGGWYTDAPTPAPYSSVFSGNTNSWRQVQPTTRAAIISGFSTVGSSDLNRDGQYTLIDLDAIVAGLQANSQDYLYDTNNDGRVDLLDWTEVRYHIDVTAGDANFDGIFDSTDIVQLFQAGKYENDIYRDTRWSEGDFTGDLEFDSSDLIAAFVSGNYKTANAIAVPEPSAAFLFALGCLLVCRFR